MRLASIKTKLNLLTYRHKIFTLLAFLTIIFIFLSLVIIINTPSSSGYELSIYSAYPQIFWFFMIISMILSVSIIIYSAVSNSNYWRYSILYLFLIYSIILCLPLIRGYYLFARGSNDLFSHFMNVQNILNSGHVEPTLIYPFMHILTVALNLIGLPSRYCIYFLGILFSFIYIVSIYMIGKVTLKNKKGSLFMLAFASPLMYSFMHITFVPSFFALAFTPLIIYCFHKRQGTNKNWEFAVVTLILSFCLVFFHPLPTIQLIFFYVVYYLFTALKMNLIPKNEINNLKHHVVNFIVILTVSFFTWYFNFSSMISTFAAFIETIFFGQERETLIEYQLQAVQMTSWSMISIIERFIKLYGSMLIYLFLALCYFAYVILKSKSKRKYIDVLYSLQYLGSLLFSIAMIFSSFVILEPVRALSFSTFVATILCGISFYRYYENTTNITKKKYIVICMILIISFSSIIGMFNIYESPWTGLPNQQMSYMESNGLDWFLEHNNYSIPVYLYYNSLGPYSIFSSTKNEFDYHKIVENGSIPSHFGYDKSNLFQTRYNQIYIITDELMRQSYLSFPENLQSYAGQYLDADFNKLNRDSKVNKIYVNNEFEVWKVYN